MKNIILIIALSIFSIQLLADDYRLDKSIHNTRSTPFLKHVGKGKWDNYLSLNLPFEPMADLFKQLLLIKRKQLASRGEAHITIITPNEYWDKFRPLGISMTRINEIALNRKVQSSQFKVLCLGKGEAVVDKKLEETYYLVIKSDDLMSIRKEIESLYLEKLGDATPSFFAEDFYPHITVGFTKKDLHESNGIIKDEKSCVSQVNVNKY